MTNKIDTIELVYAIEQGKCRICGKTLTEMDETKEDILQHLEKHRLDSLN